MKAERRHELQTNDLAQTIQDAREFLNRYGNYVIGVIVVAAVIAALIVYIHRAEATALSNAYAEVQGVALLTREGIPVTPDKADQGLETLRRVATEADSPALAQRALLKLADGAMMFALATPPTIDANYLDKAEQAYTDIVSRFSAQTIIVGHALCALANIEADRFLNDRDPQHKEKARGYLEKIRDDSRFNGTPFMTVALDKINRLDGIFQIVQFAPSPPPATQPTPMTLPVTLTPVTPPDAFRPPPLLARPEEPKTGAPTEELPPPSSQPG